MQSSRPTLTRMAVGAVLPGSALIPGFALQKKEITDSRELFFVLEHPDWLETVQIAPEYEGEMKKVAAGVNQAARVALPTGEPDAGTGRAGG